jgi:N-acetylglucosaminyl-diphospho-decaprenol L-rhamnosyltransferase
VVDEGFDIAAVVVTHNSAEVLPRCLASLRDHAGPCRVGLVVSDCGSIDDVEQIAAAHGATFLPGENVGFAGGVNRGLETGVALRARYVLCLNPDVEIIDGTLAELVSRADVFPDRGIYTARQLGADGMVDTGVTHRFRRSPFERWTLGLRRRTSQAPEPAYAEEFDTECAIGRFLVVRREVFRDIGVFDESFFLYEEENEFCLRALERGWRVRYLPVLTFRHTSVRDATQRFLQVRAAILMDGRRFGRAGALATRLWFLVTEAGDVLDPRTDYRARRAALAGLRAAVAPHTPWNRGDPVPH